MDTDWAFTPHAKQQIQRRGILPVPKEFLQRYAIRCRAPHDARYYLITKRSVERAILDGRISPQESGRILNCVYVVSESEIKTVYKQKDGLNGIRKMQRGKRKRST